MWSTKYGLKYGKKDSLSSITQFKGILMRHLQDGLVMGLGLSADLIAWPTYKKNSLRPIPMHSVHYALGYSHMATRCKYVFLIIIDHKECKCTTSKNLRSEHLIT